MMRRSIFSLFSTPGADLRTYLQASACVIRENVYDTAKTRNAVVIQRNNQEISGRFVFDLLPATVIYLQDSSIMWPTFNKYDSFDLLSEFVISVTYLQQRWLLWPTYDIRDLVDLLSGMVTFQYSQIIRLTFKKYDFFNLLPATVTHFQDSSIMWPTFNKYDFFDLLLEFVTSMTYYQQWWLFWPMFNKWDFFDLLLATVASMTYF